MKSFSGRIVFLVLSGMLVSAAAGPLPRSVSASRQFVVFGPDPRLRGGVCDLAERTKKIALALLQERDHWRTPIVIDAQLPAANLPELPPARLSLGQTGAGLKLQLDLRLGTDADAAAVEREILHAIFLEMIYRAEPDTPAGTAYVQPPDWLLEGALATAEGRESTVLAQTLETAVAAQNVLPLEEFLRQQPALLDSPSRLLYRAAAAALVTMLTDSPEDRKRLARFLVDLPRSGNDPAADLRMHFPALGNNAETLQKSWTSHLASFIARERFRLLGTAETEQALSHLLQLELGGRGGAPVVYALEEYPKFVRDPELKGALQTLTQRLLLLSGQANPLYRPVIHEYQEIAVLLARNKTRRITQRLAAAREIREHIGRRIGSIGDYMNWYEATQSHSPSGQFREYLKAAEQAFDRDYHRRDPISIYLDSLETELEN